MCCLFSQSNLFTPFGLDVRTLIVSSLSSWEIIQCKFFWLSLGSRRASSYCRRWSVLTLINCQSCITYNLHLSLMPILSLTWSVSPRRRKRRRSRQLSSVGCTLRAMSLWPVWLHGLAPSSYMELMVIHFCVTFKRDGLITLQIFRWRCVKVPEMSNTKGSKSSLLRFNR